ncbi:MAG TPA: Na+/H+ antiporter subunit E [Gammaproteobacteria bacterium]|nr:Na+/H+ antiporter subunit E [Gammaproteobacteria bacterium]
MSEGVSAGRFAAVFLRRLAVLSIAWLLIVKGAASSWWIGAPVVVLAVAATLPIRSSNPVVWWQLLQFIPFFLGRALSGGMDVAWRALHPRLPLKPGVIKYPLRLPHGLPRVVMANTVNLLPGTLTADMETCALQVHVIDRQAPFVEELEAVENAVARLFGITLD